MLRIRAHVFFDLHYEFARGRHHQHAHSLAVPLAQPARQMMQNWQHEGRGLAGAGLRDPDHVFPRKDLGDGRRLNRGGFGVTSFLDGFKDAVVETERSKWHGPPTIAHPDEMTPAFFRGR